jgi:hypothetical protein
MKNHCNDTFEQRLSALSRPYSEFNDIPRVFDNSSLKQNFNEVLPAPMKLKRAQLAKADLGPICGHGVILALDKPHTILSASDAFLDTTGFNTSQICGRSIKIFFGPKTNTVDITAAIKNTGHLQTTELKTVLYTSSGLELDLSVAFSPLVGRLGNSLRGCLLRTNFIKCEKGSPVFILEDFVCASTEETLSTSKSEVKRWQREANIITGIEINAERQEQLRRNASF